MEEQNNYYHTVTTTDIPSFNFESYSNLDITIKPLTYGYQINIGCQSFAIENVDRLLFLLEAYLKDPETTVKNWLENKFLPE
jgi:hypothetical protein